MCQRTLAGVYVYTISCMHLEKWLSFGILKIKNNYFHAVPCNLCIFYIFKICAIFAVQKVFYGHFGPSWRKADPKTCNTPLKPKIFSLNFPWPLWPWMTFTLNMLTESLWWNLEVSQTRSMSYCITSISYGSIPFMHWRRHGFLGGGTKVRVNITDKVPVRWKKYNCYLSSAVWAGICRYRTRKYWLLGFG